jgi:polyhydroxyalkanoate synthesis regulator phasin
MDVFEKQQTIEAIKTVVKGRWFLASMLFLQGVMLMIFFPEVPLPRGPSMLIILACAFILNFWFWLYCRRSVEQMSSGSVQTIKALQVFMDQVLISAVLFFAGTTGTFVIVLYFIVIMVGADLYRTKGIILSTISGCFLFTIVAFFEYKGIVYRQPPIRELFTVSFAVGNIRNLMIILFAFYTSYAGSAILAAYLASLFKKREARLQAQKDELVEKTQLLTSQTQELTTTKDYLHEALTKSDKARAELERTKVELEKTNAQLKAKVDELEKYGEVTTGRELKMVELKEEIKNLRETVKDLKGQLTLNK